MAKKEKLVKEESAEVSAPSEQVYERARVLDDFVFSVRFSPSAPSQPQTFRAGVIVNDPLLIKQMLQCEKPIKLLD